VKARLADFAGLLFVGLLIVVLVRPSSVGPDAIREFGSAMAGLIQTAVAP